MAEKPFVEKKDSLAEGGFVLFTKLGPEKASVCGVNVVGFVELAFDIWNTNHHRQVLPNVSITEK